MAETIEDAEVREVKDEPDRKHVSYETAIGKRHTTYYTEIFQLFDENPSFVNTSFNWAAFFFSAYWAFYRKVYGPACLGLAVLIFVPGVFGGDTLPLTYLIVMILFGVLGNSLYHRKVKRLLTLARIRHRSEESQELMVRLKGGVNMWVPISLASVIGIGILAAVALPAYDDYQKRTASTRASNSTVAQPQQSSALSKSYYSRISDFRDAISQGRLPTVMGVIAGGPRSGEGIWSNDAIIDLESAQTWWITEGVTYIHLTNTSPYNLASFSFAHKKDICASKAPESFYTVQLSNFLAPGQEAVAIINAGMASREGCLTLYRVWG